MIEGPALICGRAHGAQHPLPPQRHPNQTARMVEGVRGTKAHIICTRKTTPGSACREVRRARRRHDHRFGLDAGADQDNRRLASSIAEAVAGVRARAAISWWSIGVDHAGQLQG
jgi:nicotinate-nucleotide pyrophosphorylase (carboxylating)